ncbi:MAG: phosphatase PAP2 family protein [Methylophagaceae bacterium]
MIEARNKPVSRIVLQAGIPVIFTCLLLPLTFLIPLLDSTTAPYFDLTQPFSQIAYWLSFSGGTMGAPFVILLMLLLLVTRAGIAAQQRWKEACIIVVITAIFAGGGAAFNEHIIKAELKLPRPNIVWLADSDSLNMSDEAFYAIGDKEARRVPLTRALSSEPIALSPRIKAHWIEETGYSFPSGHAFSAMFIATFFLMLANTLITSKRRWLFYALLPWALAVCYSRPILRVHTPFDITVGGFQGLVLGFVAWLIARWLIIKFSSTEVE